MTIDRANTDTFAGIAPASVLPFIVAQLLGAVFGAVVLVMLFRPVQTAALAAADRTI